MIFFLNWAWKILRNDKHPEKTQISLCICAVWSVFAGHSVDGQGSKALCGQWRLLSRLQECAGCYESSLDARECSFVMLQLLCLCSNVRSGMAQFSSSHYARWYNSNGNILLLTRFFIGWDVTDDTTHSRGRHCDWTEYSRCLTLLPFRRILQNQCETV